MTFSRSNLLDILADANEGQPESRQLSYNAIVSAAYRAEMFAETTDQLLDLVKQFAETATKTVHKTSNSFVASCSDLLPSGHPITNCSIEEKIDWVAADPLLDGPKRTTIIACVSPDASATENSHAWARFSVLKKQGLLPTSFINTVTALELEASRG